MYPLALFLHVVGVGLLFGGSAVDYAVVMRMRRARTREELGSLVPVSRLVRPLHALSGLLILLSGAYMAWAAWGWTTGWIDVATLAFLATAIVGRRVFAPRFEAIERALADGVPGAEPADPALLGPELVRLTRDPRLVLWVHVLGVWLFAFLYLMTWKPGWTGSLLAMAAASALGWVLGRAALRREKGARP